MFPSDAKYLALSDQGKIEKTEAFFASIGAKKERIARESKEFIQAINQALLLSEEDKKENFVALLTSEKFEECRMFSYDFSCLRLFHMAANMEEGANIETTIQKQDSYENLVKVYQHIVFFLRRIEFDFSQYEQIELFDYMKEHEITDYYVYCVFTSEVIADKCKIALGLADLYQKMDNQIWAELYMEWVETNYATTEGMIMTLACRYLELGRVKKAYETLQKIKRPNQEIKVMLETLKKKL